MAFVEAVTSFLRRTDTVRACTKHSQTFDSRLVVRNQDFSRITGYHNVFTVSSEFESTPTLPPSYGDFGQRASRGTSTDPMAADLLPDYTSTVNLEGRVELKLEGLTPFNTIENSHWHEAYLILRGTLLSVHACKPSNSLRMDASKRHGNWEGNRGQLVKKYTMQHAEVGLASDHPKVILVPKSIVQFYPEASLEFLRATEPHLFDAQRQYVIRLRLEGHQFLCRVTNSEEREAWINALCMSIDIAAPLDERAEPQYQTLPRRRRGHRSRAEPLATLEEQQEICRQNFPHLLNEDHNLQDNLIHERATQTAAGPPAIASETERLLSAGDVILTRTSGNEIQDLDTERQELAIEDQELDTSFTLSDLEQAFERRLNYLNNLFQNVNHLLDSSPTNHSEDSATGFESGASDANGKWDSNLSVDPVRDARYRRRCMPSLVFNSRYASTFVIRDGLRLEIDWEERELKIANIEPPSYQETNPHHAMLVSETPHLSRRTARSLKDANDSGRCHQAIAIPVYLRSTTLPVPLRIEGLDSSSDQPCDSSGAPLLSAWKELRGWTQNVRAMAIREDVRATQPPALKPQNRQSSSDQNLRRFVV